MTIEYWIISLPAGSSTIPACQSTHESGPFESRKTAEAAALALLQNGAARATIIERKRIAEKA